MKHIAILTILFALIACEKESENENFLNDDYRIGTWVSSNFTDTLEFMSKTTVIRKGAYNDQYSYRIDNQALHLSISAWESSHDIIECEYDMVKLGNMFISNGMNDNSRTFYKK